MSDTDLQLLMRYTRQNVDDAFTELVRRHLNLVFSAALRQVRSAPLAEEIAQSVFTDLARQAERLAPDTILTAWLYQVTRRTAVDVIRREARRQQREHVATELNAMNSTSADWSEIEPLLDEAMHTLDQTDQTAVLLRYFGGRPLREVGQVLGTTEEAARKRVSRAVERLREFFTKRGITVGASGLVVLISANAVQSAPVGLPLTISTAALAGKAITATAATKAVAIATKSGAVTKGATALGLLGGMFAMLGGAFISLRAQAEDTKSPRERQFVLQMVGVRIAAMLSILAGFYAFRKTSASTQPFQHDVVLAAFLFVFTVLYTLFFDYTSRYRRQIQIEDGTWVEAEWTLPRSDTERSSDGARHTSQLKSYFKGAKFLAVFLVQFALAGVVVMAAWRQGWVRAALLLAALVITMAWAFRNWLKRPRFQSLRLRGLALIACSMCGLTLLKFNFHQYELGLRTSSGTLPAVVILFNAVTILAYAAFIGIFGSTRKNGVI